MGGTPPEGESRLDVGLVAAHHHFVLGPRMPGESRIHIIKQPFPGHVGLAAAPFFRRAAVHPDGAASRTGFQILFQQQAGSHRRRTQQAVAAAVTVGIPLPGFLLHKTGLLAQAGQGVVFPQDGDHRPSTAIFRHIGGGHMGHPFPDFETMGFQQIRHGLRRTDLIEFQFRIVPDTGIQPFQFFLIRFQIIHTIPSQQVIVHSCRSFHGTATHESLPSNHLPYPTVVQALPDTGCITISVWRPVPPAAVPGPGRNRRQCTAVRTGGPAGIPAGPTLPAPPPARLSGNFGRQSAGPGS